MRAILASAVLFLLPAAIHAQRLSPEEAVAVLRGSHSIADLTDAHFGDPGSGPHVFVLNSSPSAGPFGEFKPLPPTEPLSRGPYVFRSSGFCHRCDQSFRWTPEIISSPSRDGAREHGHKGGPHSGRKP